jgi:hypothetical protein
MTETKLAMLWWLAMVAMVFGTAYLVRRALPRTQTQYQLHVQQPVDTTALEQALEQCTRRVELLRTAVLDVREALPGYPRVRGLSALDWAGAANPRATAKVPGESRFTALEAKPGAGK